MKKYIKIISLGLVIVFSIIGIINKVYATSYDAGNSEDFRNFDNLQIGDQITGVSDSNTVYFVTDGNMQYYCVSYIQSIMDNSTYTVTGIYDISKDTLKGKEHGRGEFEKKDKNFALFSRILAENHGHGPRGSILIGQELVWNYWNDFQNIIHDGYSLYTDPTNPIICVRNENGIEVDWKNSPNGISSIIHQNESGGESCDKDNVVNISELYSINKEATDYSEQSKEIKSNKNDIGISFDKEENQEIIHMGPFNMAFPRNIIEFVVKNQNGSVFNGEDIKYYIFNENNEKEYIRIEDLKSEQDFFIELYPEKNEEILKTQTLKIYMKTSEWTDYKSRIVLLESGFNQRIIFVKTSQEQVQLDKEFEFNINLNGKIKIKKVDEDTGKPLAGAVFKITNSLGYERNVTTGEDGTVIVRGLVLGQYNITEVEAPNGYNVDFQTFNNENITVTVNNNDSDDKEIVVKNKKYGNLIIYKVDKDTTNGVKMLSGVNFKIYKSDENGNRYIAGGESTNPNQKSNIQWGSGKIFTTDGNGKIELYNIPVGTYYIEEIGFAENSSYKDKYIKNENATQVNVVSNYTNVKRRNQNDLDSAVYKENGIVSHGLIRLTYKDKNERLKTNKNGGYYQNHDNIIYVSENDCYGDTILGQDNQYLDVFEADGAGNIICNDIAAGTYTVDSVGIVYNSQSLVKIKIIKKDSEGLPTNFAGVQFKVKTLDNKYIKQDSGGIKYNATKGEATVYYIGADNTVTIEGLFPGKYIVEEVANNIEGYEQNVGKTEVVDAKDELNTVIVNNSKQKKESKKIAVRKIDEDTKEGLANVVLNVTAQAIEKYGGFSKNYTTDANGYIYLDTKDFKYAKKIVTDARVEAWNYYVYNDETEKYKDSNRYKIEYKRSEGYREEILVEKKDENGDVVKDKDGNIVYELVEGDYWSTDYYDIYEYRYANIKVTEVENPNKYYDEKDEKATVEITNWTEDYYNDALKEKVYEVKNKKRYVDISGYVWLDALNSKESKGNNHYNGIDNDQGKNGLIVRLKDSYGNIVMNRNNELMEKKTSELGIYSIYGGEYFFDEVKIEELGNYHIEFEYDGLIYEAVEKDISAENGSKAKDTDSRDKLDARFAGINMTAGGNSLNYSGTSSVIYSGTSGNINSFKSDSGCEVQAVTSVGDNLLSYDYSSGKTEIQYINLGIRKKEQTDLELIQKLKEAKVKINNQEHTYTYLEDDVITARSTATVTLPSYFSNVTKGISGYYSLRGIYPSDVNYISELNSSSELEIELKYMVQVRNSSSYNVRVNSIVYYYNNNMELVNYSDSDDNVLINRATLGSKNGYTMATIPCSIDMVGNSSQYMYVTLKINRANIKNALDNNINLISIAEINNFTAYKKTSWGNSVAVYDRDSMVQNTIPGSINTYEDDTDVYSLKLKYIENDRTVSGKTFIDTTSSYSVVGQIRQGDGIYNEKEDKKFANVEVRLVDLNNNTVKIWNGTSWEDAIVRTDNNGDYILSGYIPGYYQIQYIWGNSTYTVQDYKSTIYIDKELSDDDESYKWYNTINPRYSDATDNYSTRIQIDQQLVDITRNTDSEVRNAYNEVFGEVFDNTSGKIINRMKSNTESLLFGIEKSKDDNTQNGNNSLSYDVINIDFGIVERARQRLSITKRVSNINIILSNGQQLIDADIVKNPNGTYALKEKYKYVTYGPKTVNGNGFAKIEMDDEILHGAILKITYEITVNNISERDYMNEIYYKYGNKKIGYDLNPVTLRPSIIIDYLDNTIKKDSDDSSWTEEKSVNISNMLNYTYNVLWENYQNDYIKNKTILKNTAATLAETRLIAGQTAQAVLEVSKIIATEDELTFNNKVEISTITEDRNENNHTGRRVTEFSYGIVDSAEQVEIVPPTGENRSYLIIIINSIVVLIGVSVGIIIYIRKS